MVRASSSGGQRHGATESSKEVAPRCGVFATVHQIWAQEGARALWRGLGTSLWLVTNPVIQFFAYDFLKALYVHAAEISAAEAFFIGAIAKALATLLTFPLQVAQSRLRACGGGVGMVPELSGWNSQILCVLWCSAQIQTGFSNLPEVF
eukprot:s3596_g5.t1